MSHVNRMHPRVKPHGCKICNALLASMHNLQCHVKTHAQLRADTIMRETSAVR